MSRSYTSTPPSASMACSGTASLYFALPSGHPGSRSFCRWVRNYFVLLSQKIVSWISSVSIMSDYRLEDRGSIPGRAKGFCPVVSLSRPALRAIQWVSGVKRGRGAWRWPHTPSSVEVENEELYFLSPLAAAWRVTGQRFYHKETVSIPSVYIIRNKI
jgi:hypothetical protein